MPAYTKPARWNADLHADQDFSKFAIFEDLKSKLSRERSFGCGKIWYGNIQKTMTSGHVDGYRWLFAVMAGKWFFLVFDNRDAEFVQWEREAELSTEESWATFGDLDMGASPYLPHSTVFEFLFIGIENFRAAAPFDRPD